MILDLLAVLGLVLILVAWLTVQRAWLRSFPEAAFDGDALAGRPDCHVGRCATHHLQGGCLGGDCRPAEPPSNREGQRP